MEHQIPPQTLAGLNRRDFLKILSIGSGALILGGCGVHPISTLLPTPSASLIPATLPVIEPTTTVTNFPSQTDTPSQTPAPSFEYLPMADVSAKAFSLPSPQFSNPFPLMQALQERHSSREFQPDELPVALITAVLWAGFGVNRTDGKRTAPSANNVRDIDIYLITGKGLFRYEADNRSLTGLLPGDLRGYAGMQGYNLVAPLILVYVSDYSRLGMASDEERVQWSWAHSGCIAQNVYLACAALGLATVVRSSFDHLELGSRMELNPNQHITLVQTLGYPVD